ncbi:MAG: zinc ribbon domain-containing protein [Planctomycetes bacterium]|nr:zinc ribbon domain-containing protein [Planctomycetota bacterium]
MKADSLGHPFCFECGYDLNGLQLPRRCPECGKLADPETQAAEAREWFARRSPRLMWLVRPQTVPLGLWCALSDATSAKLARRRVARWLWLPAILAVVTVGFGCFVTAEYTVKVWYYDQSDPERRSIHTVTKTETDRLFAVNLHFFRGGLFFQKPVTWVQVVERQRKSLGVSVPDNIDPYTVFLGCGPLLAVLFGYLPSRKLVVAWVRYRAESERRDNLANSTHTSWSVMSVPLGMAAWAWLLPLSVYGIGLLSGAEYFIPWLHLGAVGWWVFVCLVGYGILANQYRPRLVVGIRIVLWGIAVILSLGGPAAVGWGLIHAFW